jgi:hypothetical protein
VGHADDLGVVAGRDRETSPGLISPSLPSSSIARMRPETM